MKDADWRGRKVLVTGAAGFIGSHLTERLVASGADVRAFVRYTSAGQCGWLERSPVKPDLDIVLGDVRDSFSVHQAMRDIDMVFHLAALIGVPYSYLAPQSYLRTNVDGALNVLQAARQLGTERVIFTSTSEVYGTAQYVPIDENHPLQGQSPYSATKIAADKLAETYFRSFGTPVVVVRPFNTYGPRQSARAVIPTIITQALAGTEVRLGSLTPTRDFSFVSDTVEGFIAAAISSQAVGQVINLGSGAEISVQKLADTLGNLVGKKLTLVAEDQRIRPENSEVQRLCADTAKARSVLSWKPSVSLEGGLRRTIAWIEQNISAYHVDTYAV